MHTRLPCAARWFRSRCDQRALLLLLALAACAAFPVPDAAAAATNPLPKAAKGPADKKGPAEKVETAVTNVPPKIVVIPKSVFDFKLGAGKDPFFPNSTRRLPRTAQQPPSPVLPPPSTFTNIPPVVDGSTNTGILPPTDVPPISATFLLRGVFLGKKPQATINTGPATYDFFIGDVFVVRTKEGICRVRCLEIKAGMAKIAVDGEKEPRELRQRPDL